MVIQRTLHTTMLFIDYKPVRNTEYDSSQSIDAYKNNTTDQNNT
jgi:hypothetical protein